MSWRCEPFSLPGYTGELNPAFRPLDLERAIRGLTDPAAALKTLHWGRNYLYVARLETASGPVEVVVKQFRHDHLRDRLRRRRSGSKAAKSWRVANALLAAGLFTPEPVMLVESESEAGPSSYICRYLPDVLEARYLFRAASAGEEAARFPGVDFPAFVEELGRTLRRLHDAGFWHRDMSGGNVLLRFGADRRPSALYLVDLNRARIGRSPSVSARLRDLSRLALFRPEHQKLLLASYWGGIGPPLQRPLYLAYHHGFRFKNDAKKTLRGWRDRAKRLLLPRGTHAHIPDAPPEAGVRDKIVWDPLSDQPHQHAGRLDKVRVRLADAGAHAAEAAVIAAALPRIRRRYKELKRELHRSPVDFSGIGVCVRPWPEAPETLLSLIEELRVRHVLLRLHPWEEDHAAEEDLARELHARGCELTYALPQNRDLVRDPARWRRALEEIAPRFVLYGRRFQVGQAINRSKWGIWNLGEYARLAGVAEQVLRPYGGVELLGPAVIDFEYHVTAAVLNRRRAGFRFDIASALLYVDRRGAPENRQAGLDTAAKVLLLKAIAGTSRNAVDRCWITEVNWPLREGPHSPAGRDVAVDEETQADYLVRYYLLALGTGAVERVFWWQVVARGYGLVDPADPSAPRRRPSFHALQTLIRELDGARLEAVLPAPPPACLYRFRRPDGAKVIAGWSAADRSVKVTLPRSAIAVTSRDGEELAVPEGVEVEVSGSPRYFRLG
ncbi:MAG TPA: lipopolysaccharide kinase InaA family protein [Thermoanaerobaculia bacterium]|jgi:tRNA A-37 threonylcarbamoyl transferase component Bud32|nr:lipopolysaccharide kinase InaA family protein [Thermoanaerobaculia bacterium]